MQPTENYSTPRRTLDVEDYLLQHHRVPARVFIGPDPVAPADFLVALANAYPELARGNKVERVALGKDVPVLTKRRVAPSEPKLYGGWVIHRQDFVAPHLVEVTKLQAWTLKPALRAQ